MDDRLVTGEDEGLLMERLIQVENALFFLKVKSNSIEGWKGDDEVERLEKLRKELHASYARLCHPYPDRMDGRDIGMATASSG
jgi:hypothetical protein